MIRSACAARARARPIGTRHHTRRRPSRRSCRSSGSTSANHGSGTVQLADTTCAAPCPSSVIAASACRRATGSGTGSALARSTGGSPARNARTAAAARARVSSGQTSGSPVAPPSTSTSQLSADGPGRPLVPSPGSSRAPSWARRQISRSWLPGPLGGQRSTREGGPDPRAGGALEGPQRLVHPQVGKERGRHGGDAASSGPVRERRHTFDTVQQRCHVARLPVSKVRWTPGHHSRRTGPPRHPAAPSLL